VTAERGDAGPRQLCRTADRRFGEVIGFRAGPGAPDAVTLPAVGARLTFDEIYEDSGC
jgi:hypothetical protein